MNSAFWRYIILLSVLLIIWNDFFIYGGIFNQLAFNFALYYPLGFLAGYRREREDQLTAFIAAFSFNLLSYLIAGAAGIPIESWLIVIVDFISVFIIIKIGIIVGGY